VDRVRADRRSKAVEALAPVWSGHVGDRMVVRSLLQELHHGCPSHRCRGLTWQVGNEPRHFRLDEPPIKRKCSSSPSRVGNRRAAFAMSSRNGARLARRCSAVESLMCAIKFADVGNGIRGGGGDL
jgi:hypothetical protein